MTKTDAPDKRLCHTCHADISWRSAQARYCSRKCTTEYVLMQALGPIIEHECLNCGTIFKPKTRHMKKFCGPKCMLESTKQRSRKKLEQIQCGYCTKKFLQERPNQLYCAQSCRVSAMNFAYRNGMTMPDVRDMQIPNSMGKTKKSSTENETDEVVLENKYPRPAGRAPVCPTCADKETVAECKWDAQWGRYWDNCEPCALRINEDAERRRNAAPKIAPVVELPQPVINRPLEDWEIAPICQKCKVNQCKEVIDSTCEACKQRILDVEIQRQIKAIEDGEGGFKND